MPSFLLDEHLSPEVAAIVLRLRPEIQVVGLLDWQEGFWIGESDEDILRAARTAGKTLVSYDQRTIPPLLHRWAETEEAHAGAMFVDERTIPQTTCPALHIPGFAFGPDIGTGIGPIGLPFCRAFRSDSLSENISG